LGRDVVNPKQKTPANSSRSRTNAAFTEVCSRCSATEKQPQSTSRCCPMAKPRTARNSNSNVAMAGSPPRQRRSTARPMRISTIGSRIATTGRSVSGTRPNASIDLANAFGLDSLTAPAQRNNPPKSQRNVVVATMWTLQFKLLPPAGDCPENCGAIAWHFRQLTGKMQIDNFNYTDNYY